MDAINNIMTRRSIRVFNEEQVPESKIEIILKAAMQAPTAKNVQPWHFVIIKDRETLSKIASFHPTAPMAANAPLAITICGDTTSKIAPDCWVLDCAAASENLLLAAHAIGLGAVWTANYPIKDIQIFMKKLLNLPENIEAHSTIILGYPGHPYNPPKERYNYERIHQEKW